MSEIENLKELCIQSLNRNRRTKDQMLTSLCLVRGSVPGFALGNDPDYLFGVIVKGALANFSRYHDALERFVAASGSPSPE
jgi:hypothetical protein